MPAHHIYRVMLAATLLLVFAGSAVASLSSAGGVSSRRRDVTSSSNQPYVAAAVEHVCYTPSAPVVSVADALAVMHKNLDVLTAKVTEAADREADMVVLSEMALTSLNFNRSQMALFLAQLPAAQAAESGPSAVVPCDSSSSQPQLAVLSRLSCLARNASVYLVVNWGDRIPCPHVGMPCPVNNTDGHWQFNTQVVLAPTGAFIAKYHKEHTFNATEFDTPPSSDPTFFDMIPRRSVFFGRPVRVGLATCFDSMFPSPMLPLLHQHNVSDFVLSHWWVNQYATMAAAPWFEAVSRGLGINLVFAASTWPAVFPWGSGSGIAARGAVVQSFYRSEHKDVVVGNDALLVGALTSVATPPLAEQLPPYAPPMHHAAPPAKSVVAARLFTGAELTAAVAGGFSVNATVTTATGFSCTLSAFPTRPGVTVPAANATASWLLFANDGYYAEADGTRTYYYDQFCAFSQCRRPSCLLDGGQWDFIENDHGGRPFASVALTADAMRLGSVVFPMLMQGDGNVPEDVVQAATLSYPSGPAAGQPVVGATTQKDVRLNAVMPYRNMIGASILSRPYDLDWRVTSAGETEVKSKA